MTTRHVCLFAATIGAMSMTHADFAPPGMWTNDNWFARSGDIYHAFYLQVPRAIGDDNCWKLRQGLQWVGHATSTDLANWTDQGPVIVPIRGTWVEALATGSVARCDGRWWMVFTVNAGKPGVGLAVSDDLMKWELVGDGPVLPSGVYTGTWQGQPLKWWPCADPYLYPEPVDGWMVMVINAQVEGAPAGEGGCLATMRSRDLKTWEPGPVLLYPQMIERLETPQLWRHGSRWYLCFGAAHDQKEVSAQWRATVPADIKDRRRVNCVYMSDRWDGGYAPMPGKWWLDAPHPNGGGYIHKVIAGPDGRDRLITTTGNLKLSPPYEVVYGEDGGITLR